MENKIHGIDPNVTNPDKPEANQAPPDPSNTSNIGQRVEQGIIGTKDSLYEQGHEWQDKLERKIPENTGITEKAKGYLKNPSPEERESGE